MLNFNKEYFLSPQKDQAIDNILWKPKSSERDYLSPKCISKTKKSKTYNLISLYYCIYRNGFGHQAIIGCDWAGNVLHRYFYFDDCIDPIPNDSPLKIQVNSIKNVIAEYDIPKCWLFETENNNQEMRVL